MPLDLHVDEIPALITWFNSFVTFGELKNRFERVNLKLDAGAKFSPAVARRYQFHLTYQDLIKRKRLGRTPDIRNFAVNDTLSFIAAIRLAAREMSSGELSRLKYRILEGLSPDRDIRQLQHESRAYVHYKQAGCKITWRDSERDRFDFLVEGPKGLFEVECKTFSDNIGHPISLDASMVLFQEINRHLKESRHLRKSGTVEIKINNVELPTPLTFASMLKDFFKCPRHASYNNVNFNFVERPDLDDALRIEDRQAVLDKFIAWQSENNRHCMIGVRGPNAIFIALEGHRLSRPYNAIFASLKKASAQFSKSRPAVIWGHFLGLDEDQMWELLKREHNKGKALDLFGSYLFGSENRSHVCRLRLSADGTAMKGAHGQKAGVVRSGGPAYDLTSSVSRFDPTVIEER